MRAPTPALIHARAKAPLVSLEALHLSDAGIDCVKHLEICQCLRSLYADNNRLTSADSVVQLHTLWRIDLSGNRLRNISALAAFRALGFLNLERNCLDFKQVATLRGMHIIDLRLVGNAELGDSTQPDEYRTKVVALLPTLWTLDGHYISASGRRFAMEECESLTSAILSEATQSNEMPSGSILWSSSSSSSFGASDQHQNASKILDIVLQEPESRFIHDLNRLHTIIGFFNEEAAVHNAHVSFAVKREQNARVMSFISLDLFQQLPRTARLNVTALLVAYLRFQFEQTLLVEALTLELLDTSVPTQVIYQTAALPPYALTALATILRHQAVKEEEDLRRSQSPGIQSETFASECETWRGIPDIVSTVFSESSSLDSEGDKFMSAWCDLAVRLLSRAASFPQPDAPPKGKKDGTSFAKIAPLLAAAYSSASSITSLTVAVSSGIVQSDQREGKNRNYERPWAAQPSSSALGRSQSVPNLDMPELPRDNSASHRRPRLGEWIEVRPKQFVKIVNVSSDAAFVSAAPLSQQSVVLTISSDHLIRMSGNAWRLSDAANSADLDSFINRMGPRHSPSLTSLCGKLHRDSEGFHRHGAARNQGFPNFEADSESVKSTGVLDEASRTLARSIELFASNDTLDANYVLASPHAITVQNYCASRVFSERNQNPGGLWKPIEHAAPYHVIAAAPTDSKLPTSSEAVMMQPNAGGLSETEESATTSDANDNEWDDIKRQLQTVLGISRPTPSRSGSESASSCEPTARSTSSTPARQPRLQPLRTPWHAVPTKTSFLVGSPSSLQLQQQQQLQSVTRSPGWSNGNASTSAGRAPLRSDPHMQPQTVNQKACVQLPCNLPVLSRSTLSASSKKSSAPACVLRGAAMED